MVSIDKAKLILAAFSQAPGKPQYIRQVASNCYLSYERVQHYLKELEKINVLRASTKGKIKEYTINRRHELTVKIFSFLEMEKRQKFYSKNPQFQVWLGTLANELTKNMEKTPADIRFILLFGSTARGDSGGGSDVDILIVARNAGSALEPVLKHLKIRLETLSGRVFSFHPVDYGEFAARWKKEPIYATIWLDHVVLYGEESFWKEVLERGEPV